MRALGPSTTNFVTSAVRIVTFTNRFHALSHCTTIRNKVNRCRKLKKNKRGIQIQIDRDKNIDFAVFGVCCRLGEIVKWRKCWKRNCNWESVCLWLFVRVPTGGVAGSQAKKRRLGQDWSASTAAKSPSRDVGRGSGGGSYLVAEANSDWQSTGTSQALQSLSMRTRFPAICTPFLTSNSSFVYLFFGQHLRVCHRLAWKWSKSITTNSGYSECTHYHTLITEYQP